MYEQSLMHRDIVTHVAVTPRTDFAITASVDGHVKFWKKLAVGIEFVKHFVAHSAPVNALAVSLDGLRAATTSEDGSVKVFSVATFDMVNIIELPFTPTCAAWIFRPGALECVLAVAEKDAGTIHCYNTGVSGGHAEAELSRCALHRHPVVAMAYSASADVVVSADVKGMLEYWCADPELTPAAGAAAAADGDADDDGFARVVRAHAAPRAPGRVSFRFKMDTGLYALVKAKTRPTSLAFDPAGERFVVSSTDAHVRVFSLRSGELSHEYDESLAASAAAQARASGGGDGGRGAMEEMDWSKRSAVEREMLALQEKHVFPPRVPCSNALFDCSGEFVLFATLNGVKMLHLASNFTGRIVGAVENTERFTSIALFQGVAQNSSQMLGSHSESLMKKARSSEAGDISGGASNGAVPDPTVFACAFKKQRFYLFSQVRHRGGAAPRRAARVRAFRRVSPTAHGGAHPLLSATPPSPLSLASFFFFCLLLASRAHSFFFCLLPPSPPFPARSRAQREPDDSGETGRDVFNEKPTATNRLILAEAHKNTLAKSAIIRTTMGDIHVELYGDKCPRTVENFTCVRLWPSLAASAQCARPSLHVSRTLSPRRSFCPPPPPFHPVQRALSRRVLRRDDRAPRNSSVHASNGRSARRRHWRRVDLGRRV
jgi:hypothetical protein